MNAQRNDDSDNREGPQDAVASLMRASVEAMESFMKTDWMKDAEKSGMPLSPLMASPAAMMAAATAYGVRMTGQWASAFLSAMETQTEANPASADAQGPEVRQTDTEAKAPQEAEATKVKVKRAAKAPKVEAAKGADDLKRISGIGPKLATVLAARGVDGFAALAGMDEKALAALDAELGLDGRILRDDWAGQAKAILSARGKK